MEPKLTTRQDCEYWAWQFLRRNPEYIADWHKQLALYKEKLQRHYENPEACEHPSGAPLAPNGAEWLKPGDNGFCILWSGATHKWGLDFWRNPEEDRLPYLCFMDNKGGSECLIIYNRDEDEDHLIDYVFDLSRPLGPQLAEARQYLQTNQEMRSRAGYIETKRIRIYPGNWPQYLKVLDARAAGQTWRGIMESLYPDYLRSVSPSDARARSDYRAAKKLMESDYYEIAVMPLASKGSG